MPVNITTAGNYARGAGLVCCSTGCYAVNYGMFAPFGPAWYPRYKRFPRRPTSNPMKLRLFVFSMSWMCVGGLIAPAQVALNPRPSRELGHAAEAFNPLNPFPSSVNPNLVEGRELFAPSGIAMDTGVSPPIVYVSDSGNNRVLGWN